MKKKPRKLTKEEQKTYQASLKMDMEALGMTAKEMKAWVEKGDEYLVKSSISGV